MKNLLSTSWNTLFDIFFPLECIGCGRPGTALCLSCVSKFPAPERILEGTIFSLFSYRHPTVRKSIWMLKYRNRPGITDELGRALFERMLLEYVDLKQFKNFTDPIVIPIPLSKKREHTRGYNQAALLSKRALSFDTEKLFSYAELLTRNRDTKPQAHIRNRALRLKNLVNSFSATHQEKIRGRNIILIDDVTTTGATLKEAGRALKEAGAKRIVAFTIAH